MNRYRVSVTDSDGVVIYTHLIDTREMEEYGFWDATVIQERMTQQLGDEIMKAVMKEQEVVE